jgi:hypothetical protein
LHSLRAALIVVPLHTLGHGILAQPQRNIFDLLDRMRKRRNVCRIDGLHLLDQTEELVKLLKRMLGFARRELDARQMRDAVYVREGQGHAVTKDKEKRHPGGESAGEDTRRFSSNELKL